MTDGGTGSNWPQQQPGYPPPPGAPPPPGQYAPGQYPPPQQFGPGPQFPGMQQAGYGYTSGPAVAPPSLGGIATATMILVGVTVIPCLLGAAALLHRASLVDDIGNASLADLQDADSRVGSAFAFFILTYAVAGICWVIWQYRHGKVAQALGRRDGLGPGWAIGGWFVPIGSFFLPQSQLLNASKASDLTGRGRPVGVVGAWWGALVLSQVVFFYAQITRPGEDFFSRADLDSFRTADQAAAVGMLLLVVAAVLAIATVNACTARMRSVFTTAAAAPR